MQILNEVKESSLLLETGYAIRNIFDNGENYIYSFATDAN
jgi:hypothetical protein